MAAAELVNKTLIGLVQKLTKTDRCQVNIFILKHSYLMCFFRKWIVSVFDSFLSILLKIGCSRQSKINAKDAASPRGFVFYLPVTWYVYHRGVPTLDQSFFSLCIKQSIVWVLSFFQKKKRKKRKQFIYIFH